MPQLDFTEERISVDADSTGHTLHIVQDGGDGVEVWLNTGISDYDGLIVGLGDSRQEAVADAIKSLEALVDALQQPPVSALKGGA